MYSPLFQSRIGEKTPQRPSVEAGPVLPWRLSGRAKHTDNDLCCIVFESLRLRLFPFLFEWIHAPMLDSVVVHPAFFTGMIAFVLPLLETAMGRLPFGIPSWFLLPPSPLVFLLYLRSRRVRSSRCRNAALFQQAQRGSSGCTNCATACLLLAYMLCISIG